MFSHFHHYFSKFFYFPYLFLKFSSSSFQFSFPSHFLPKIEIARKKEISFEVEALDVVNVWKKIYKEI